MKQFTTADTENHRGLKAFLCAPSVSSVSAVVNLNLPYIQLKANLN
jgi:hypothetical protein